MSVVLLFRMLRQEDHKFRDCLSCIEQPYLNERKNQKVPCWVHADWSSVCRVGDAVLGLACMVLLLVLKLMRKRVPPPHPEMPFGVKFSCGLVWTVTTGEEAS